MRMIGMRNVVAMAAVVAATAAVGASADQTFGAGVKLASATQIQKLYDAPETFVGKTVRVDGVVTAVCEEMGCWMAIAPANDRERVVRFKVEHDGELVFPLSARGKAASVRRMIRSSVRTASTG